MDIKESFRSVSNKRLLWDLLLKNNMFTNIPPEKETLVKKLFESKVEMIVNEKGDDKTLSSLNKKLFSVFVPELKKLQITEKGVTFADNLQKSQPESNIILSDGNIITAEKQMEIRQSQFKNSLESMQSDFSNMINREIPKEIDFSDASKDTDNVDIDKRMEEIIKSRESEMKTMFKDKPTNINSVNTAPAVNAINVSSNNTRRKLVIGDKTVIEDIILLGDNSNNIINNDSVTKMLREILENQRNILERLETIKIL